MNEGNDTNTTPENDTEDSVTLEGYQAYVAQMMERNNQLLEAQLVMLEALMESNMRVYDALYVLLTQVSGSREMPDGLRKQHSEGSYYFPPFALSETPGEDKDEDE